MGVPRRHVVRARVGASSYRGGALEGSGGANPPTASREAKGSEVARVGSEACGIGSTMTRWASSRARPTRHAHSQPHGPPPGVTGRISRMHGSPTRHSRTTAFGRTPRARRYAASVGMRVVSHTRATSPARRSTIGTGVEWLASGIGGPRGEFKMINNSCCRICCGGRKMILR